MLLANYAIAFQRDALGLFLPCFHPVVVPICGWLENCMVARPIALLLEVTVPFQGSVWEKRRIMRANRN